MSAPGFFLRAGLALAAGGFLGAAQARPDFAPPWQGGANNDVAKDRRGLEFTEPDADNLADFHGSPDHPRLALFVGGNYFFAMAPLVAAFEKRRPDFKGRIYWETLPPGLLVAQIKAGGAVTVGNMSWTVKPDAYFAGLRAVTQHIEDGLLQGPAVAYVTNTLTIMVPKGNPAQVSGLADLGKPGLKLAMPNPEFEGIARQIKASLAKAGGEALVKAVYDAKVANGETLLTHIHHRQSPLHLLRGEAQAAVTWRSEAVFQERIGHPIAHVEIPEALNSTAIYAGAVAKGAPHPAAAKMWLEFLRAPEAQKIFQDYGFKPCRG
jgi:ABC-type molybdate transport system substrate-binding protein